MNRLFLILAFVAVPTAAIYAGVILLRPTLDRVGILLWEMTEIHRAYADKIIVGRERMSAEQASALARGVASDLARHRDKLAQLAGQLESSDLTTALRKFLDQWPNEEAFFRDLLAGDKTGDKCGAAITGLAMQAPDKRWRWKTLLPIYRP